MIANISTGGYAKGMVAYNHKKTEGEDKLGNKKALFLGTENGKGESLNEITKTINDYNKLNPNVKKPNIHISLSFHKDDILDNEDMKRIAKDYLDNLGMGSQPYAIYRHFDTEHPHIHIVSSLVKLDGKKVDDSFLYYRSQKITRDLEEQYDLTKALESKSLNTTNEIQKSIDDYFELNKGSLLPIMNTILTEVLKTRPTNDKEFDYQLEKFQVKRILEEGKGHSFALLPKDEFEYYEGNKQRAIPGHEIEGEFAYENLNAILEVNYKSKKEGLKNVMGKVYSVFNSLEEKKQLDEILLLLKKKGIDTTVKRRNTGDEIGKINGLIFRDTKSNISYNASDLKLKVSEYSEKIIDNQISSLEDVNQLESESVSLPEHIESPTINNDKDESTFLSLTETLGDLILSFQNSQDLSEEELKRKKKRRKRK